jgi:putative metalloprotease
MKTKSIVLGITFITLSISSATAQINLGGKALGALQKGASALMFKNEDAIQMAKLAVVKLDSANTVAPANNGYAVRLNRLFGKHATEQGLNLNYKVYLTKDVNAFAAADGSVRVFSGLMDIMDDNQLLAVIGHEIGHVANEDTKDAIKNAYLKEALIDGASSQSDKIAAITDSQYGKIGSALVDSKHSRKQENDADVFSYDFMKRNGYNVNAVESAFNLLASQSEGAQGDFLSRMMSSHPDPKDRAEKAKAKAIKEGLYVAYVPQKINNTVATKQPVKKAPAKKAPAKKTKK